MLIRGRSAPLLRRGHAAEGGHLLGRAAALLVVLLAACAPLSAQPTDGEASRPLRIVATTGIVADLVRNIGGERVEVTALMGPGVDPHLYRPTAGDVRRLETADALFYHGLELEGRMSDLFARLARSGRPTFAVTAEVPRALLRPAAEVEGAFDPHLWHDVALWRIVAKTVARQLSTLDPGAAELYARNHAAYDAQLEELDRYVAAQAATLPPRSRVLVTAHDAFGYFGARYGFEVRALQGISTVTEASAADVRELAGFLCERGVKAVFLETTVAPATIEAVRRAAMANGCLVTLGGSLYSDALGGAETPASTYIGMVRANIDTIVRALQ
ncbi:MAG: zinc ABC transporter substrate-binding protein [Chloroflexota bacterium]|nr:zinc ABC transporter substrate-binding protein [Dehalococcoidia bacterium]MDW8254063.1 zinc ABC transporter substrate-binding protein [Chloroflexota bacterium]